MTDIVYPSDAKTIILFGGSDILPRLVLALQERKYGVFVFTSPRQAQENIGGVTLLDKLESLNVSFWVKEDIADFPMHLISQTTIGLGIGEAWVFPEKIRSAFGNRLLGFMAIPLPRYRGGAHLSWAIMRGERQWGGCLQTITANTVPGEFDDGEIVSRWEYAIPERCRIPQHWFDFCGEQDIRGILDFLKMVAMRRAFHPEPVSNAASLFLPRLRTCDNGWIDWNQPVVELERQICAFDSPYPGALTMLCDPLYGDRQVAVKDVSFDGVFSLSVPFQRGLVLRVDNGIHIAALNGVIVARRVLFSGMDFTDRVKVGMRFFTPVERLEHALRSTPVYSPKVTQ